MPLTLIRGRKLGDPDAKLCADQLQVLQEMVKVYGWAYLGQNLLWILRKRPEEDTTQILPNEHWNRRLVPFRFNRIQRDLNARMGLRNICNKPRQAGYTTFFINRRLFLETILDPGSNGLLISQTKSYATIHFSILKRAHRYVACIDPWKEELNFLHRQLCQHLLHTTSSNRKEIIFDQLDSRIMIESAEVEEAGQGVTLKRVVATEVARWRHNPEETLANLKEAIMEGGSLDIESTPNGLGGYFYEEFSRAERGGPDAEFKCFFHPWWWHDEYAIPTDLTEEDLTEEERHRQELFHWSLNQIAWRRKKMVSLRHNFAEKYPEDSRSCFLTTGRLFFDQEILAARLAELQVYKPITTERNGEVRIFKLPIPGRRYILGLDPAEGKQVTLEEGDFSAAKMLDEETGEEVAAYMSRLAPEDFAADGVELCQEYNNALFACERNNHGGTVILAARELGYGNIYKHKEWFKRHRQSKQVEVAEYEGWPTNVRTRKLLLNKYGWQLRHFPETIWDIELVKQCLTFCYDEHGKPAALPGNFDDMVLASAIAHIVRWVKLGYIDPLTWKSVKYGVFEEADEEMEHTV